RTGSGNTGSRRNRVDRCHRSRRSSPARMRWGRRRRVRRQRRRAAESDISCLFSSWAAGRIAEVSREGKRNYDGAMSHTLSAADPSSEKAPPGEPPPMEIPDEYISIVGYLDAPCEDAAALA